MRANITYSVDVDSIPEEILRVVRAEQLYLSTLFEVVQSQIRKKSYLEAREGMMKLRRALGDSDIRLFESDKILAGYVDMLNQDDSEKQDTLEEDGMQAQGEE